MKRALIPLALVLSLLLPIPSWAAITFVQSKICTDGPIAANTITCTFNSTTTAGNFLVIGAGELVGTVTAITITDDKSNTYTQRQIITGSVSDAVASTAPVTTAGTTVVTATFTNSVQPTYHGLCMMEYSGVDTTGIDGNNGNSQSSPGTGTDAVTSLAITPTANNELLVGWHWNTNNLTGVFTVGTGWTQRENKNTGSSMMGMCQDLQQTTATSQASVATVSSNQEAKSIVIALKVAPNTVLKQPSLPMGVIQ